MADTLQQCAGPGCSCAVPTGQKFCSDYCAQHSQDDAGEGGGSCGCGHPGCGKT